MPDEVIVVFDSNVLIPAIIPASLSARPFTRLEAAGWIVAASPQLLAEVRDKLATKPSLRQWLGLSDEAISEFVGTTLPGKTRWIAGTYTAPGAVPADPKDDMVIAAAIEAGASYLISEDKHLLTLGNYQGIWILNRQAFAAELDRLGVPESP
jgi:putative PIN family toxin of toxin-antitoxin system